MNDAPYGHNCGTCRWFLSDLGKCVRYPKIEDTTADEWCGEWKITVRAEMEAMRDAYEARSRRPSGRLL